MRGGPIAGGKQRLSARRGAVPAAIAGLLALAFAAPPTLAQVARPPQVTPPTRSEVERVPIPPADARPTRLTISGGIERAPCPLDAPRFAQVKLTLAKVVFAGLGPIAPASLDATWRPLVGQTLPIGTVCEIRDAAATILRRQGYLAAVQVPPQRIEAGVIKLDVLMARLVAIHVRGNAGHAERRIAAILATLKSDAPFNQNVAERALLLAGDLPGFDVHLTLRAAGTVPGDVIGDVTVTRTALVVNGNVQNSGSRAVGPFSGLATVEANDLLGLGDRAVVGLYSTANPREQTVVQGSYEIRPGAHGLTLAARTTYARTHPSIGNGNPITAETLIGTLEASYPLVRRQIMTVRAAGGMDVIAQKVRFTGLPLTDDQLRMLYVRIEADATDPAATADALARVARWHVAGAIELRHGIAGLGASRDCGAAPLYMRCAATPALSRLDADPQGTLIRASGSATILLLPRWTLAISPRAQVAFDPLLSFEQFSAGNYTIGRGYDPGALNGDSGVGAQTELRFGAVPAPHVPSLFVQPFAFVDVARIWTLGPIASIYRTQSILTAGGGARLTLAARASAELTLAVPIGQTPLPNLDRGLRALISVTTHFAAGQ